MRQLASAGLIAFAFGLGSYYATGEFAAFGWINLACGSLALLVAGVSRLGRLRGLGTPAARRLIWPRVALLLALLAGAVALERAADALKLRLDWTVDQRFALSPATRQTLARLPDDLVATLFYDPLDPRIRSTRLLLESLATTLIVRDATSTSA